MEKIYLKDCDSLDDVKIKYKGYIERYLPRSGHRGNRRIARAVEKEYEYYRKLPSYEEVRSEIRLDFTNFQFLIKELIKMDLDIEMCGKWLFATGPTGLYAKDLLELGFRFSAAIGRWCYHPIGFDAPSLEGMNMEYIRKTFGSDKQGINGVPAAKTNPQGRGELK